MQEKLILDLLAGGGKVSNNLFCLIMQSTELDILDTGNPSLICE